MQHVQADFAPTIADYIYTYGIVSYPEMFDLIERNFTLNDDDLEKYDNNITHWQHAITNLRSNNHFIKYFDGIVNIDAGFATANYAEKNGIYVVKTRADLSSAELPRKPRETRYALGIIVNDAYTALGKPTLTSNKLARDNISAMIANNTALTNDAIIIKAQEIIEKYIK